MKPIARGRKRKDGMNGLESDFLVTVIVPDVEAGKILWWMFEAIKFRLADNTFYTPDFCVMRDDYELVAYEVKGGWFPEHNRVKTKVAADRFPVRFILARRPRPPKEDPARKRPAREDPWTYDEI
jgi:hypothetical protein